MIDFRAVQLPPGYHIEASQGELRLLDPDGIVVGAAATVNALLRLEERAWRHAWGEIDREVRQEAREFREGSRTVPQLRRMRQYVSLLEAVATAPGAAGEAPAAGVPAPSAAFRPARLAGAAVPLALAAAALLIFLLLPADRSVPTASDVAQPQSETVATAPAQPPARQGAPAPVQRRAQHDSAVEAASPTQPGSRAQASSPAKGGASQAVTTSGKAAAKRSAAAGKPKTIARPPTGYALLFGKFPNLQDAEDYARRVRAKGYLATVTGRRGSFTVIGRIYPSRSQAEHMARVLADIALPASVLPVRI